MPHAVEDAVEDAAEGAVEGTVEGTVEGAAENNDADTLQEFLDEENLINANELLDEIHGRDLDLGEKANDAEDYGDISDEDLAEDESELPQPSKDKPSATAADQDDGIDLFDDLFGDAEPTSPDAKRAKAEDGLDDDDDDILPDADDGDQALEQSIEQLDNRDVEPEEEDAETREQRLLFEQARIEREERRRRIEDLGDLPPPPTTDAELFSTIWPQFEPDKPPRFGELLPGKKAFYPGRKPLRAPKPIHPSKVNLEVQQDQEKLFKAPAPLTQSFEARKAEAAANGLILVADTEPASESSDDEPELDVANDQEVIGGVTYQDLIALCQDWDIPDGDNISVDQGNLDDIDMNGHDDLFDDENDFDPWNFNSPPRSSKKIKSAHTSFGPLSAVQDFNLNIDEPEKTTAKLAKKVHLDMNDPLMLIDVQQQSPAQTAKRKFTRDSAGGFTKDLSLRYNISNDQAYELLKQNHQSSIRSTIENIKVEHSTPALRLQYPFYKIKLSRSEARSWHRPTLHLKPTHVVFSKPLFHKKKHIKGKTPEELFATTKDLSVADNSSLLLLEYSEEYPMMMSSFGMNSRLINYYRRKDEKDTARPKLEVGETQPLLPNDKSPFSKFGNVDPGQIVSTIANDMYRAPVFKHTPNKRDFVVSRNTNGVEGSSWYLRNVENLHVVGQEFPYVAVPQPNARMVTDVRKRRLQMLSNRLYANHGKVANDLMLAHNPDWDLVACRTKLKEFMTYDKHAQIYFPKDREDFAGEAETRTMLKPQDIAILEAMQVGDRQLQDAGYHQAEYAQDMDDEDDEVQPQSKPAKNLSLEEQLVPWKISKHFLEACKDGSMVAVHGEGDPTGRGEAFSFIKTSMKGGFKEIGESIEDRLDAKKQKELGGHKYNVAKQAKAYDAAIRRVWDAQTRGLSSTVEHDDDIDMDDDEEDQGATPASNRDRLRRDDETGSLFSKNSSMGGANKVLRITRVVKDKYGKQETKQEIVRDPKVIHEYIKRRRAADVASLSFDDLKKTGDPQKDAMIETALRQELERLNRNVERRHVREKAKGIDTAASPEDSSGLSPDNRNDGDTPKKRNVAGTTARKCANCGQVGHIKTNKKLCSICIYILCPMLNGTIKQDQGFGDSAFGSIASPSNVPQSAGSPPG